MAKALRMHSVLSDGQPNPDAIIEHTLVDPDTGRPYAGDDGQPSVVIVLRPLSHDEWRRIVRKHTQRLPNKRTRAMEEVTDWDAVQDDATSRVILSWRGILGADDKPLVCNDDTKRALDGELKNELVARAMRPEGVDASDESFREPA